MYKLNFDNRKQFPFPTMGNVKLHRANFNRNELIQLYSLFEGTLNCYYFQNGEWKMAKIDKNVQSEDVNMYRFGDIFNKKRDVLVTSGPRGSKFYASNMSLIAESNAIKIADERYDFFDFGNFIERKPNMILTKQKNKIALYLGAQNLFQFDKPMLQYYLEKNIIDLPTTSILYISSILKKGIDDVIVQSTKGVHIYEIDLPMNEFSILFHIGCCNDMNGRLYFVDITGGIVQDILYFNNSGLYVHQYDMELNRYRFSNSYPLFSVEKGWNEMYANTVQFEDIDYDGKHEMIFTGPQGISILKYNAFSNQWQSILDNTGNTIAQRSGSVITAVTDTPNPTVFILIKDKVYPASLEYLKDITRSPIILTREQAMLPPSGKPQITPKIVEFKSDKEILLLRDHFDYSFIRETIDRSTGKLQFILSLIDIPYLTIKLKMVYNAASTGVLGFGWSFDETLILLDHQGSVFKEDHRYYVMSSSSMEELKLTSPGWKLNEFQFVNAPSDANVSIQYDVSSMRWTVRTPTMTQIFGKVNHPKESGEVVMERYWPMWRGDGNGTDSKRGPVAWYLAQVIDEFGNSLFFNYKSIPREPSFKNNICNTVYLSSISDDCGNQLSFTHGNRNSEEVSYERRDKFHFHTNKNVFLSGYVLETVKYKQEVEFKYTAINKRSLLTSISQKHDYQPVLRFNYDYLDNLIVKITLPNDVSAIYEYNFLEFPLINTGLLVEVPWEYKVNYGSDYTIISYLNHDKMLQLSIYNKEMTALLYSSGNELPIYGSPNITLYEIHVGSNYLLNRMWYEDTSSIALHHWENGVLNPKPFTESFEYFTLVERGHDFIVVSECKPKIQVIDWNGEMWSTKKVNTGNFNSTVAAHKGMFVLYDNKKVDLWRRDVKGSWYSTNLMNLDGYLSTFSTSLAKFNLNDREFQRMYYLTKNCMLQFENNIVLVTRWYIDSEGSVRGSYFKFALNEDLKVKIHSLNLIHGKVHSFEKEIEFPNGDIAIVSYDKDYKLTVKDFRGPSKQELEKGRKKLLERGERKSEIDSTILEAEKNIKGQLKDAILKTNELQLPYEKFYAILAGPTVTTHTKRWRFNGKDWQEEEKPPGEKNELDKNKKTFSIPLGDYFLLDKKSNDSQVQLHRIKGEKLGSNVISLGNLQLANITIKYPVYLAYPKGDLKTGVIEFSNEGTEVKQYELPLKGHLSPASNYEGIFAVVNETSEYVVLDINTHLFKYNMGANLPFNNDGRRKQPMIRGNDHQVITFFHMMGVQRYLPIPTVYRSVIKYDQEMEREVGFNYSTSNTSISNNVVYFKYCKVSPGNDNKLFGWIEESLTKSGTNRIFYNNRGKIVKREERSFSQKATNETDKVHKESTLFDKSNEIPVARFFPYSIENGDVSYYGFEDYETNRFGKVQWDFKKENIKRNKFSFTGQNYLNLNSPNQLEGAFHVENNNMMFVASTWVRPHGKVLAVGAVVPYLKVLVDEDVSFLGEIKLKSGNWYYLESVVNLYYANLMLDKGAKRGRNPKMIYIKVIISTESGTSIDVDHVRFSPLNCLYQATVYDKATKEVRDIIQHNGLVNRYLYDKYGEKIAKINELGQLTEFNTYTKATDRRLAQKKNSYITVKTVNGFYEDFNPDTLHLNWNLDDASAFQVSPGQLKHAKYGSHSMQLHATTGLNKNSFGIRLYYKLSEYAYLKINSVIELKSISKTVASLYFDRKSVVLIPNAAELLLIREGGRFFIWIDGALSFDKGGVKFDSRSKSSPLKIEFNNDVKITELLIFNNPNVGVTYFNDIGEKVQQLDLQDEQTAIVTEYLYDQLGRQSITTKPIALSPRDTNNLLAYYSRLVTNKNPKSRESIWKTGNLKSEEILGVAIGSRDYTEIMFHGDSTDIVHFISLPGLPNSKTVHFRIGFQYNILYSDALASLYPLEKNYTHSTQGKGDGRYEIIVEDVNKSRVAWYVHGSDRNNSLCTYEYDADQRMVKMLPRLYHERAGTLTKKRNQALTTQDKELQKLLGISFTYHDGVLSSKRTPDRGLVNNYYNEDGLLQEVKYQYFRNDHLKDKHIFFTHDAVARLKSTGLLLDKNDLSNFLQNNNDALPTYQTFHYSDWHTEPRLRGRLNRIITYNHNNPLIEESLLNGQQEVVMKRIILPPRDQDEALSIEINKKYAGGRVIEINYPVLVQNQPFTLHHEYDKLDRLVGIGFTGDSSLFFNFTYSGTGQLETETHYPRSQHNFQQRYTYNSPGFLTMIAGKYLTEQISYTDPDYSGFQYRDGTITRTQYTAHWHRYTSGDGAELNERSFISGEITADYSRLCFYLFKENGYIDELNHQSQIFYSKLEPFFPIICSGRNITMTLGKKGFPKHYGHIYSYDMHGELMRGKYFVGNVLPGRLQPQAFELEPSVNADLSQKIWQSLLQNGYIVLDHEIFNSTLYGRQGKSYGRIRNQQQLVANLEIDVSLMDRILTHYYSQRKSCSKGEFQDKLSLIMVHKDSKSVKIEAPRTYDNLKRQNYFADPLDVSIKESLKFAQAAIPHVVHKLLEYSGIELGEAEFDVGPYKSDVNGNIKEFWSGFDHYLITYIENSNRIDKVKVKAGIPSMPEKSYAVGHDHQGNVVKALHKGITQIYYHPVLDRASKVLLEDGQCVIFHYDARGERVLKRVVDNNRRTLKEVHYIRDELGRTLVERQLTYLAPNGPTDLLVTAFIYGPRGLIGFVRRDEFHSVITDHEYSTRLVVKGDQVIAAYDYLPYGGLMREYASYPEAHIRYRYTGQEFDEEIGLYNYHARLYDPSIGRFYQVDPKDRNCSPYVYASNSPISVIDPKGEEPVTAVLCFVGFLIGAYFGAAAANGSYNPFAWDWSDLSTWLGILGGGLAGALIPAGFAGSVAALALVKSIPVVLTYLIPAALGTVTSYLSIAATFNELNPLNWDWTSPKLWEAAIKGFAVGSGAIGGISGAAAMFKTLSVTSKVLFLGTTALVAGGSIYVAGHANNWDFTKPKLWYDLLEAILGAADLPMAMKGSLRFLSKNKQMLTSKLRNAKLMLRQMPFSLAILSQIKPTLMPALRSAGTLIALPLITASIVYFHGAMLNDWDFTSPETYKAIIDSLISGYQLGKISKGFYRKYYSNTKMELSTIITDISENANPIAGNTIDLLASDDSSAGPVSIISEKKDLKIFASRDSKTGSNQSPNFIYSTFPTRRGNVAITFATKNKYSSPFLGDATTGNVQIDNKELMNRLEETHEGTNQNNKIQLTSLIADIGKILNEVEWFQHMTKYEIKETIQQNIISNGYLVGGKKFITKTLGKFSEEAIRDLLQDINIDKLSRDKQRKLQLIKTNDKILPEINTINKEIGEKFGIVNDEIENLKYQVKLASDKIWKLIQQLEVVSVGSVPTSNSYSEILSDVLIDINPITNYNDEKIDIYFERLSGVNDYFEKFEVCHQCKVTAARFMEDDVIPDPGRKSIKEEWLDSDLRGSKDHFFAPFNEIRTSAVNNNERPKRSLNENQLKEKNVISQDMIPVTSQQSCVNSLFDWLKGFMKLPTSQHNNYKTYENNIPIESTISIDLPSTLFLAKFFVAKKLNNKVYIPKANVNISYTDALAHALKMVEAYEKEIIEAALKVQLPKKLLNIDFNQIHNDLLDKIIGNKTHEIFALLHSYTTSAFPDDELDNEMIERRSLFLDSMDLFVQQLVHKSLNEMFEIGGKYFENRDKSYGNQATDDNYSTEILLTSDPDLPAADVKNIN